MKKYLYCRGLKTVPFRVRILLAALVLIYEKPRPNGRGDRNSLIFLATCLLVVGVFSKIFANELIWEEISRGNSDLSTVLVYPDDPNVIFIGQAKGILKSEDAGESWSDVLKVDGRNNRVNFLFCDRKNKNSLYAATNDGLFYSSNIGKSWSRIFRAKSYAETVCKVLTVSEQAIFLGTQNGLLVSKDKGRIWNKATGVLGKSDILAIASNPKEENYLYVACTQGLFKTENAGQSWEKIFNANLTEDDDKEKIEDMDEAIGFSQINYLSLDSNNPDHLYLATKKGVYISQDRGRIWQPITDYGLLDKDVRFLMVSDDSVLFAVTKSGVFMYQQQRWNELSCRLLVEEVRSLTFDTQDNLYAACDKGLFKAKFLNANCDIQNPSISLYTQDEPDINEVQQAAVKYAEVEPEKIKEWRRMAAKKAWLPEVSMGLNSDTTDLWHWEGGSTTKNDDDILRRGRSSLEWDVRLTWDLGDVIWNDAQTSIDVRSRLMVELRDDILDEVTKLYFERIRVKMEIDGLSIEDRKKRIEKELRLNELTAYLDGLTNGYFSKQCIKK